MDAAMQAMQDSTTNTNTTTTMSLVARGGFLLVLVVLFQWFVARAPNATKETKRRFQHALTGHALVQISYVLPRSISLALLAIGSVGMYAAKTFFFEQFLVAFGGLLRPKELSGDVLPGAFYFLIGTALTISGWVTDDLRIARYSVECLALADPMASWIGSSVASPNLYKVGSRTSSLAGCAACFGTALAVGWWMLLLTGAASDDGDSSISGENGHHPARTYDFTPWTVVVGALACTVAEGLPFGNDNLNIPVITALVVDRFAGSVSV